MPDRLRSLIRRRCGLVTLDAFALALVAALAVAGCASSQPEAAPTYPQNPPPPVVYRPLPAQTTPPPGYPPPDPRATLPPPPRTVLVAPPRVVVAPAPRTVVVMQPYCQSQIDCGFGTWCRDRGDGLKLCMGNGAHDDACVFGTDCGVGLFCRDRGDGFKVCM